MRVISRPAAGDMIRRLLLAWLLTGAIQYTCLPAPERVLSGFSALTGQSFPLLLVGTAASFALLTLAGLRWRTARWERAALLLCFGWQLVLGLCASWSVPLLCAGLVVLALLLVYAAYGARTDAESLTAAPGVHRPPRGTCDRRGRRSRVSCGSAGADGVPRAELCRADL